MINEFKIVNDIKELPFFLFYQGDYTLSPTESIIKVVEKHFAPTIKIANLKRLIYLLIESLQNIERYSAHVLSSEDFSLIYCDGKAFYIITQNTIYNDKVKDLSNRLNAIANKNQEELEKTYIQVLSSETKTEKGAGLGLIDIARKTKNNLYYSFTTGLDSYSIFNMGFSIPMDKSMDEITLDVIKTESIVKEFKENFKGNKSSLIYGGDFSTTFIKSLLDLLKTAKVNELNSKNRKTHHLLIEMIQNVKKHGVEIENGSRGQLFLEWKESGLHITTYNLIENEQSNRLIKKIETLNEADEESLKIISKDNLQDFNQQGGLGLIDVATLIFPRKIEVKTIKKPNLVSELMLSIHVNYE